MIGWWTAEPHRRRGIATEIVRLLTTWALGPQLGLKILVAEVEPANPGSLAVAMAAGYQEVGRRDDGRLVMAAVAATGAVIGSGRRV
jgi:RimJ/RimL family protein N-acetyltransferase